MRYLTRFSIIFLLMLTLSFHQVFAQEPVNIEAKAALLMEAASGDILFEKNIHQQLPPASITKMMTYLLAMEAVKSGTVTMEDDVMISIKAPQEKGASYRLTPGESVKLRELIEAMMIVSANDATVAIAEHIEGNVELFVQKMNEKARALGLTKSHFVNVNGMPEPEGGNLMTARDIAVLSKYLIDCYEKELLLLTDKESLESPTRNFYKENTNGLLKILPEVDGLKTGYTDEAGYCLVSTMNVRKTGDNEKPFRLIAVVLGTENESRRAIESQKLLEYGYTNYTKKRILQKGQRIDQINLWNIKELPIELRAKEDVWAVGPKAGLEKSRRLSLLPKLALPIHKGEKLGELEIILYNDTTLTVDAVSDRDIKRIPFAIFIKRFWLILQGSLSSLF